MVNPEAPHMTEIEITPKIETEIIQMIETINIKITDHGIIQTIDHTIKDQIIKITIDHVTIHRTEIQIIKTGGEIFRNHHIGIIHVIKIHNNTIGVVHLSIKDK